MTNRLYLLNFEFDLFYLMFTLIQSKIFNVWKVDVLKLMFCSISVRIHDDCTIFYILDCLDKIKMGTGFQDSNVLVSERKSPTKYFTGAGWQDAVYTICKYKH